MLNLLITDDEINALIDFNRSKQYEYADDEDYLAAHLYKRRADFIFTERLASE